MKKRNNLIRVLFATVLTGVVAFSSGCGDLMSKAVKNGIYNYITGGSTGTGVITQFGDFVTDFFTGGFVGDNSGN